MNWNQLRIFYYAAHYGSFTRTAEKLNISQSAISQSILLLEGRLEKKLFDRTAKGLSLTKAGEKLYQHIAKAFAEIEAAESFLKRDEEEEAKGELRILTTQALTYSWLIYFIPGFLERHPHLHLLVHGNDKKYDLEQVDTAILPYKSNQPGLIQRYLTTFHIRLYASREYLQKFGMPRCIEDLDNHRLITYGDPSPPTPCGDLGWVLHHNTATGQPRTPYLQINSAHARLIAAQLGLGITELGKDDPEVKTSGLIEVLPHIDSPTVDIYYIYPKSMEGSKRITALGDYLTEILANSEDQKNRWIPKVIMND